MSKHTSSGYKAKYEDSAFAFLIEIATLIILST